MAIVRDNRKQWDVLRRQLEQLHDTEVVAGITNSAHVGGQSVAEYAAYNEFGTSRIPARPFMRTAFDDNQQKLERMVLRAGREVVLGKITGAQFFNGVGLQMQNVIKRQIRSNMDPRNAISTVKAKGSDHTLIDTGVMLSNVTFEIRKLGATKG